MDSSFLKLLGCCAALAAGAPSFAQEASESLPITFEADSWDLDRNNNLYTFERLQLTHGDLSLQAGRAVASGLAGNSEWEFTGGVRITVGTALLEADSAKLTFGDGELATAELAGDPARFSDTNPDREEPAQGGAYSFAYDYAARTLRLSDGAWLRVGPHEISGCDLIYDFAAGRATSGSGCGERFSITIDPRAGEPASDTARSP